MILVLLLGVLLAAVAVGLGLKAALGSRMEGRELLVQVGAYGFGAGEPAGPRLPGRLSSSDLATRVGERFGKRVNVEQRRELRQLLNAAGYYRTTVTRYVGYRVLAVVGIPGTVLLLASAWGSVGVVAILLVVISAGLAWVLPKTMVERRIRKRTAAIDYEVPELVDLLVTTVEAGVGFAGALQLSARRVRDPLGQELRLTLREQGLGLTMDEALKNMLERTSRSISMRAFVQAIVQGEQLGVSIGKILRDLAVDMRKRRRQVAEERAQKAPVKLLFPLTFLILPATLIVILGPAVRAISHGLGGG